jgi:hypothetical protein
MSVINYRENLWLCHVILKEVKSQELESGIEKLVTTDFWIQASDS